MLYLDSLTDVKGDIGISLNILFVYKSGESFFVYSGIIPFTLWHSGSSLFCHPEI